MVFRTPRGNIAPCHSCRVRRVRKVCLNLYNFHFPDLRSGCLAGKIGRCRRRVLFRPFERARRCVKHRGLRTDSCIYFKFVFFWNPCSSDELDVLLKECLSLQAHPATERKPCRLKRLLKSHVAKFHLAVEPTAHFTIHLGQVTGRLCWRWSPVDMQFLQDSHRAALLDKALLSGRPESDDGMCGPTEFLVGKPGSVAAGQTASHNGSRAQAKLHTAQPPGKLTSPIVSRSALRGQPSASVGRHGSFAFLGSAADKFSLASWSGQVTYMRLRASILRRERLYPVPALWSVAHGTRVFPSRLSLSAGEAYQAWLLFQSRYSSLANKLMPRSISTKALAQIFYGLPPKARMHYCNPHWQPALAEPTPRSQLLILNPGSSLSPTGSATKTTSQALPCPLPVAALPQLGVALESHNVQNSVTISLQPVPTIVCADQPWRQESATQPPRAVAPAWFSKAQSSVMVEQPAAHSLLEQAPGTPQQTAMAPPSSTTPAVSVGSVVASRGSKRKFQEETELERTTASAVLWSADIPLQELPALQFPGMLDGRSMMPLDNKDGRPRRRTNYFTSMLDPVAAPATISASARRAPSAVDSAADKMPMVTTFGPNTRITREYKAYITSLQVCPFKGEGGGKGDTVSYSSMVILMHGLLLSRCCCDRVVAQQKCRHEEAWQVARKKAPWKFGVYMQ